METSSTGNLNLLRGKNKFPKDLAKSRGRVVYVKIETPIINKKSLTKIKTVINKDSFVILKNKNSNKTSPLLEKNKFIKEVKISSIAIDLIFLTAILKGILQILYKNITTKNVKTYGKILFKKNKIKIYIKVTINFVFGVALCIKELPQIYCPKVTLLNFLSPFLTKYFLLL